VIFVEGFRLLFVLLGAIAGLQAGTAATGTSAGRVVGLTIGALAAYVLGGVGGRLLDRGLQQLVGRMRATPPGEVFAGTIVGTGGLLLGLAAGLPLVALVHSTLDYPGVALLAWVLGALGLRVGVTKGREIVRAAGLAHLLEPPVVPPPAGAVVVDTSALLDRFLLVLGRAGLLADGLIVPTFALDEARTIAASPDPVSSRRARRGLEALEALRQAGVEVRLIDAEVPEESDAGAKALVLARRIGARLATCSAEVARRGASAGLDVVDLRRLAAELRPDHLPGERLVVDLVRPGTQPGQAVGYLPEGDMVVVNDAAALVGSAGVEVVVSGTRQTSQGLLVFATLVPEGGKTGVRGRDVGQDRKDAKTAAHSRTVG
jgi:uncharacterized protein YacL